MTAATSSTGTAAILYVDLTPPTVALETTLLTQQQALGQQVVELSGLFARCPLVYMVEVSIDGGPWDMAGVADDAGAIRGCWMRADGTQHIVAVRALDVAGHTAEVAADVTLDIVAPAAAPSTMDM
ncbi:MAG: hypothetical protein H6644_02770 [Caldilineaceae bacterium]|nr:hypothetical protein [Caldilineaceae bacterium]